MSPSFASKPAFGTVKPLSETLDELPVVMPSRPSNTARFRGGSVASLYRTTMDQPANATSWFRFVSETESTPEMRYAPSPSARTASVASATDS